LKARCACLIGYGKIDFALFLANVTVAAKDLGVPRESLFADLIQAFSQKLDKGLRRSLPETPTLSNERRPNGRLRIVSFADVLLHQTACFVAIRLKKRPFVTQM